MIQIEQIDTQAQEQVRRFIDIPLHLYADCPHWVPALSSIQEIYLDTENNPFYAQAQAEFFIAVRDGCDVGRIAVIDRHLRNELSGIPRIEFFAFDCENNAQTAKNLFDQVLEWAKQRQASEVVGPRVPFVLEGAGILVDGFDARQVMTMTSYNYDYYADLIEANGFEKADDYLTYQVEVADFQLPDWVQEVAAWVQQKEGLTIQSFTNLDEVGQVMPYMLALYRRLLGDPVTPARMKGEADALMQTIHMFVNPALIKAVMHGENLVGFILAFPDVSTVLQQAQGSPDQDALAQALQSPQSVALNGICIAPEFQLQGINAMFFSELERMAHAIEVQSATIIQVNETTMHMSQDLKSLGIQPTQTHRLYIHQF